MPRTAAARVRLALWIVLPPLAIGSALRVTLYACFHPGVFAPLALGVCGAIGLLLDLLTGGLLAAPLLAALALLPARLLQCARIRHVLLALLYGGLLFHAIAQWYFFEEFAARFNHIALDYLIYPHEVFANLVESYNVPLLVLLALVGGVAGAWLAGRSLRGWTFTKLRWSSRLGALAMITVVALACCAALRFLPTRWRDDRIENEVAENGSLSLVHAWTTASLDWHVYYPSLPSAEAQARAARVLHPGATRTTTPAPPPASGSEASSEAMPPSQVVVVLEESFGSEFVGVLGHPEEQLTPCFDRWSKEGLLLTQLVANGNRTVRGLEGVLASFVPLPGDAIVKRDKSDHVATLARVFRGRGWSTTFLYGGYALFDSMKSFLGRNGWDEFVEQPDYPADAFRTAWGVADRWIFDALVARQLAARANHERLFATILSVSNHRPFDIPAESPVAKRELDRRWRGVAYADECLGRYLDRIRAEGLLDDTLLLIVGDHGARVYGSEAIPAPSYRVPALFLASDVRWRGARIDRLCSQIDLAPTLLELAGVREPTPFLGTSLLSLPAAGGRAFLQHNRDVGMVTDHALVVLGLEKSVDYYTRPSKESDLFTKVPEADVTAELRSLADDATAVFQSAYESYEARRYVFDPAPQTDPSAPSR